MTHPCSYVMVSIFCLLFSIDTVVMAQAKQPFIGGKVYNENKAPLADISVKLFTKGKSSAVATAQTDSNGVFLFTKLPLGALYVEIDVFGYHKSVHPNLIITENSPGHDLGTIVLQVMAQQLESVEIQSKKQLITQRDGKMIVNVAASLLAAGSTAMEILSRVPGVTLDNEGNVSLRGKPGVSIMIDGKLTYLSAAQLVNLLRSTPGNSIETIEVVANPSAKYDATGTGGIINIKLKKKISSGTNGTITSGAGFGRYAKADAGLTLNHSNGKVNIFGNYNYSNNKQFEDLLLTRSVRDLSDVTFFYQNAQEVSSRKNNNYKVGIDFLVNANNTIGLMINGYDNGYSGETGIITQIGRQSGQVDSTVRAQNSFDGRYRNQTYNLNYKSVLDTLGQELNADMDFSRVRNMATANYDNFFFNGSGLSFRAPIRFRNFSPSKIEILAAKLDYTLALPRKLKLETGVKSSLVHTDNDFTAQNWLDEQWTNNEGQTNRFVYKENVNAAYLNLSKEFKATTFHLGLRAELTHTEGKSVTLEERVVRNYIDFFPSLSGNHDLGDENTIGLTYSRRIDRPDYQALNPFVYYSDLYTKSQGNPALQPQYANSLELSYGHKKLHVTLGYIRTRDVITTTLLTNADEKSILFYEQNLASRSTFSFNVNKPFELTDWWSTSNDATLYHSRFASPELMGIPFENQKTTLELSSIHTFRFSKTLNAEMAATYTSSQVYGTYIARPIYGVDLGIGQSFAGEKVNLKLAVNDVFNQRQITIKSAMPAQDYRVKQKQESRIFRLTFSYNFGSSSISGARERSNGNSAEQERVKSGR